MPNNLQLNLNVRGLKESATMRINAISQQLAREGREIFKLGLGQSPFPVPDEVVKTLQERAAEKDYLPVQGLAELRSAVAGYLTRKHGLGFEADDILVAPGSKEMMFLLQLVYYGDLVIPAPSWVSYAPQAHIIGRHVHWLMTNPENDWRLMPEDLKKLCEIDPDRPRIVVLNYPSNPTGRSYSAERLQELAEVAAKYEVIILSDEIYGELHFEGAHESIAKYYPEGTIVSTGLSKWCGAGGWRLGVFAFPKQLRRLLGGMTAVASETFTSTSAPVQYAAVTAFHGSPAIEKYLTDSRRILKALGNFMHSRLTACGASVTSPQGGFYLFPDFSPLAEKLRWRGISSGSELVKVLLKETGVACLSGIDFGRPDRELTARLAYVDFDGAAALKAAADTDSIDENFLIKYTPKLTEAMNRLSEFLG